MDRKTRTKKFRAALASIWDWCKTNRHTPMTRQHRELNAKVRNHYTYYGIRGNSRTLGRFFDEAKRT